MGRRCFFFFEIESVFCSAVVVLDVFYRALVGKRQKRERGKWVATHLCLGRCRLIPPLSIERVRRRRKSRNIRLITEMTLNIPTGRRRVRLSAVSFSYVNDPMKMRECFYSSCCCFFGFILLRGRKKNRKKKKLTRFLYLFS